MHRVDGEDDEDGVVTSGGGEVTLTHILKEIREMKGIFDRNQSKTEHEQ